MQSYTFITAEEIITRAKAEAIGSTASQLSALQDEQLIERVEQLNAEFVNAAHTQSPLGGWSWMRKVTNFKTKAHTTLNGAVSSGASTVVLTSASDFDSSGRIVTETAKGAIDFIDYSSKATHTLTVDQSKDPVSMDHATGQRVEKLYSLPSDYSKTRMLYVNSTLYLYERVDQFPSIGHFTTFGAYILMPKSIGAQDCTHYYEKRAATIDEIIDTTDVPTEFQRYAIEKLKAHIYMVRRKRQDIELSLMLADQCLQSALAQDMQQTSQSETTTLPLPY